MSYTGKAMAKPVPMLANSEVEQYSHFAKQNEYI